MVYCPEDFEEDLAIAEMEWEVLEDFEADSAEIFANGLKHPDARRDPSRMKVLNHSRRCVVRGPQSFQVRWENRRFRQATKQNLKVFTDGGEPVNESLVYMPFRRTCRSLYD